METSTRRGALLDRLQVHKGGLVRIKSELYWYGGRGWDGIRGRLCLVLDVVTASPLGPAADAHTITVRFDPGGLRGGRGAATLLLVDGAPRWVWVVARDIELLDGGDR